MRIADARALAREWVKEEAGRLPGFSGAYLAGSINDLPDGADLPATSDVDVMVVIDHPDPPVKPGKIRYDGVLLEISYVALGDIRTPEQVLGHYHLAGAFRRPVVLADPTGHLASLGRVVSREFARRHWVERRCTQARDTVARRLVDAGADTPLHQRFMAWLFAAGGLPHVLLVAGLRNPTVRKRYAAARDLLAEVGLADRYPVLLEALGVAEMTPERVTEHLDALGEAFDAAAAVVRSPFFFASDISALARPLAIDGSRELIARGEHREAVFWIAATFSRCMMVFRADAPDEVARWEVPYRALLADLGLRSVDDLPRRCADVRAALPEVWAMAQALMAANWDG